MPYKSLAAPLAALIDKARHLQWSIEESGRRLSEQLCRFPARYTRSICVSSRLIDEISNAPKIRALLQETSQGIAILSTLQELRESLCDEIELPEHVVSGTWGGDKVNRSRHRRKAMRIARETGRSIDDVLNDMEAAKQKAAKKTFYKHKVFHETSSRRRQRRSSESDA